MTVEILTDTKLNIALLWLNNSYCDNEKVDLVATGFMSITGSAYACSCLCQQLSYSVTMW